MLQALATVWTRMNWNRIRHNISTIFIIWVRVEPSSQGTATGNQSGGIRLADPLYMWLAWPILILTGRLTPCNPSANTSRMPEGERFPDTNNLPAFQYLNIEQMPKQLLAGNFAQRALNHLFEIWRCLSDGRSLPYTGRMLSGDIQGL